METIEQQLAEWLTELTGIYVLPEFDKDQEPNIINKSHGVLRLVSDNHGVNDEIYTQNTGYAVDFVIIKTESEKFNHTMAKIAHDYNTSDIELSDSIAFKDGLKGKFYFGNCIINGDIESTEGIDRVSYQMTFSLSLFESLMPSDNSLIKINGQDLKGVINLVPSFALEKEGFVVNGNTQPKYETSSKTLVIQIQYMPLEGNEASNFLLNKMNTLDTSSFNASIKWPATNNPIVDIEGTFFAKDITLNLVKGSFAGVNVTLVKEA